MGDFLSFRTMIAPVIIEILFWIGVAASIIAGLGMIIYGAVNLSLGMGQYIWKGILVFILGPIVVRVCCEILIVFFRINETLTEIKHAIEDRRMAQS